MAKIEKGFCPTCLKQRELCEIKFGVIRSTLCTFCLERYLSTVVNPSLLKNNRTSDDNLIAEVFVDDSD